MGQISPPSTPEQAPEATGPRAARRIASPQILVAILVALLVTQQWIVPLLDVAWLRTWATVFVAICVQAMPFLVFGVLVSAAITAFVPATFFTRWMPRRPAVAVPVAGLSGAVLPGCECASVPVAGSLMARGVTPAAALAFLLASPAINPIVLVSTAVAFPNRPGMVVARFATSLVVAVVMGWLWLRLGREDLLRLPRRQSAVGERPWTTFRESAQHDFLHAGGFLVVGALVAASLNVLVPSDVLDAVADRPWLAVAALAILAVVVAICSEADAFVAASFTGFPPAAQLAFMAVGPVVDVKLVSLQVGTFGRAFTTRFAPATFVVAVATSVLIAGILL
jgi:uncharacterized membrane protein YraQ (UPF0718 family)